MKKRKIKITIWREGEYKVQYRYWEVGEHYYTFLGMCEIGIISKTWYPETEPSAKRLLIA